MMSKQEEIEQVGGRLAQLTFFFKIFTSMVNRYLELDYRHLQNKLANLVLRIVIKL